MSVTTVMALAPGGHHHRGTTTATVVTAITLATTLATTFDSTYHLPIQAPASPTSPPLASPGPSSLKRLPHLASRPAPAHRFTRPQEANPGTGPPHPLCIRVAHGEDFKISS